VSTARNRIGNDSPPLRLAYFSPLPPARSGIADYSRELLPYLAELCSLTLFVKDPEEVDRSLRADFDVQPLSTYAQQRWRYDLPLYQMGNSMHHEALYQVMRRFPGVVVLHDCVLHHFLAHRSAGQADPATYARELAYNLGGDGIDRVWALRHGEVENDLVGLPLNRRVLDLSLGVLVHSAYVRTRLAATHNRCPILTVPAPIASPVARPRRDLLPWPEDAIIFASFGQMTAAKRLDRALHAFAELRARDPRLRYLLVGEPMEDSDLPALIRRLDLEGSVFLAGHAPGLQSFLNWLVTADVVINLRHPTLGETSATALRALAAARPLIVYDHGWYRELPDDVAVKIPPLDDAALRTALEDLAMRPQRRAALAEAARAYAIRAHHPRQTARAYAAAIRRIVHDVTGFDGDA
jgi:glycosyltransferase involved in cell wall biosynthesis